MSTYLSTISELKTIRKHKSNLLKREAELTAPILTDFNLIPDIYAFICSLTGECTEKSENVIVRKQFLLIILLLYCPTALVGGKMTSGLREKIVKTLNCVSQSTISDNCADIDFLYQAYKDFRQDADFLYEKVVKYLKGEGMLSE